MLSFLRVIRIVLVRHEPPAHTLPQAGGGEIPDFRAL
jgi:hypothetical protein